MADTKITALTALTAADPANDVIPIVDVSDTSMAASGTTKKISVNNILGASGTATLASATITGDLTVDTNTLKVDSTNNRVGIGTATPSVAFEVKKTGLGSVTSIVLSRTTENVTDTQGVVWKSDDLSINYAGVLGVIDSGTAGSLALQTATGGTLATKVTIDGTGNLSLATGNVVMATSGKGIDFSATPGTGTSELLNDYEEGTFTPTVIGTTTAGTIGTYFAQTGRYTKVGKLVTVQVYLAYNGGTGTGNLAFAGLPFTIANNGNEFAVAAIGQFDTIALTALNVPAVFGAPNTTRFNLYQFPTGGGVTVEVPYDAAGAIMFTSTYFTA